MFKRATLLVFLFILPFQVWASYDIENAYPEPELKPNDVVRLQLLAMQQNDDSDFGIEVTFRFASPANKKQTGPLKRFIRLVRNPSYRPLLNHINATFLELNIEEDFAVQDVIITTSNRERIGYRFRLSIQKGPLYPGCWMTDSVIPFKVMEV
ncbi:MAG: DUF4864 domain-containing protein [SAR324 cluster bacterium]|nr:DUF4864 domain-containing protein [SAR324 cluster bacterium]